MCREISNLRLAQSIEARPLISSRWIAPHREQISRETGALVERSGE
jgi:hypothetical protein